MVHVAWTIVVGLQMPVVPKDGGGGRRWGKAFKQAPAVLGPLGVIGEAQCAASFARQCDAETDSLTVCKCRFRTKRPCAETKPGTVSVGRDVRFVAASF